MQNTSFYKERAQITNMNSSTVSLFIKRILVVNGVIDILTGIPMLFFPRILASLMGFTEFSDAFRFLAGGWGIAAICFGITRIWVGARELFVWPTVILGCCEGGMLTIFCGMLLITTSLSWWNVFLPFAIGITFMFFYGIILLSRRTPSQK